MDKKNKMILVLGLMAFLTNGDNYAAAPLLINIAKDLNLTISTAAISVTAYMLAFGLFTILFGPLSDRYGKVKVINIAAVGTAVFSILGAFAFNLPSLIFFRAVNGAFGAGIFPVTMALVGQSFDDKNRQKALGKVMGLMFLGAATATAVGGAIAYVGSWRLVYMIYGVGELILAFVMLKILKRDEPIISQLNFIKAYKEPLTNFRFMRLALTIFFVGFSVFGSFSYSGKLLQEMSGYNILMVGLILSLFGIGTVIGGRIVPKAKEMMKGLLLVFAGIVGGLSLYALSATQNVLLLSLGLLGFGIAFIFMQSTLIAAAQDQLPKLRGTAMSITSFNMFVGGAVGNSINAKVLSAAGASQIFFYASFVMLAVGLAGALFMAMNSTQKQA